jgi:hypothetical protein
MAVVLDDAPELQGLVGEVAKVEGQPSDEHRVRHIASPSKPFEPWCERSIPSGREQDVEARVGTRKCYAAAI